MTQDANIPTAASATAEEAGRRIADQILEEAANESQAQEPQMQEHHLQEHQHQELPQHENIPIDTTVPSNAAHAYEVATNEVLFQHGLAASRITFGALESWSLEQFVKYMNEHPEGVAGEVFRIDAGDDRWIINKHQVLRYRDTRIQEVPIGDLRKLIGTTKKIELQLNCPYPVVRYNQLENGETTLVCRVPERFSVYALRNGRHYQFDTGVWMPELLFKLIYNINNLSAAPNIYILAIGTDDNLYRWPGANVFPDYRLCTGSWLWDKTLSIPGEKMQDCVEGFFGAGHNHDLEHYPSERELEALYKEAVEAMPEQTAVIVAELKKRDLEVTDRDTLKKLAVMKRKGAWQSIAKRVDNVTIGGF
jgi:hypothetical protein